MLKSLLGAATALSLLGVAACGQTTSEQADTATTDSTYDQSAQSGATTDMSTPDQSGMATTTDPSAPPATGDTTTTPPPATTTP